MASDIISVIVGGVIGITGGFSTAYILNTLDNRRHKRSITAIVVGEIEAVKEKAQRFVNCESTIEELKASTPMLISIASELGYLSDGQVIAYRRVVTLDMEMRQKGNKEKARICISACDEAQTLF